MAAETRVSQVGDGVYRVEIDGRAETVRLLHPSALREFLARGLAPRALLEAERFREIGHLDGAGVLLIGRRPFAIEFVKNPLRLVLRSEHSCYTAPDRQA